MRRPRGFLFVVVLGMIVIIGGILLGLFGCGREEAPPAPMTIVPDTLPEYYGPTIELVDVEFMPVDALGRLSNNGFTVNLHLRTHQMDQQSFAVAVELEARDLSEGDTAPWTVRDSERQSVVNPEGEGELIFTTLRGAGPALDQRVVLRVDEADSAVHVIGFPKTLPIVTTYEF